MRAREDRLFERYRTRGDPTALAALFDDIAPELIRVSRYLAGNQELAEDLVQETFLTAMRDADRWDASRPVMPWLLGILANAARTARRRLRSAPDVSPPEAPDFPSPGHGPADSAQAQELEAALAHAFRRMPKPYAETLQRHLIHDMAPIEIAKADGAASSTVRMRIHRGMEQLRTLLPTGFTAGVIGASNASASAGLAAVRNRVLAHAQTLAGSSLAGPASTLSVGYILMKKSLWILGSILAVAALTWVWMDEPPIDAPQPAEATPKRMAALTADDRVPPSRDDATPSTPEKEPERSPQPAPSTLRAEAVRLQFVIAGTEQPIAGLRLNASGRTSEVVTDEEGRVSLPGTGTLQVSCTALDYQQKFPCTTATAAATRVEIPARTHLDLTVRDKSGRLLPDATVWWLPSAPLEAAWSRLGITDRDGRLRRDTVANAVVLRARCAGHVPSPPVSADNHAGITASEELRLRGVARGLRGRVVDPRGMPVPEAKIALQNAPVRAVPPSPIYITTDRDGRFASRELGSAACQLITTGIVEVHPSPGQPDDGMRFARTVLTAGSEDLEIEISLGPGALVEGTVTGLNAADGAVIVRASPADPRLSIELQLATARSCTADSQGRFRIPGLLPGKTLLVARRGTDARRRITSLVNGATAVWNPTFTATAARNIRLVDSDGKPLNGWDIHFYSGEKLLAQKETSKDGAASITCEHDAAVLVTAIAPGCGVASLRDHALEPTPAEQELRVRAARMPSAQISGQIVATGGATLAGLRVMLLREGGSEHREQSHDWNPETGVFRFRPLVPGAYMLGVARGPRVIASRPPQRVGVGQDLSLGKIEVQPPRTLRFRLPRSGAPRDLVLGMTRGNEFFPLPKRCKRVGDEIRVTDVPAGDFEFALWGPTVLFRAYRVDTAKTEVVDCAPTRSGSLKLVFQRRFSGTVRLRALRGAFDRSEPIAVQVGESHRRGLAAGDYEITLDAPKRTLRATVPARGVATVTVN